MQKALAFREVVAWRSRWLALALVVVASTGCQGWYTSPDFGETVRQAVQAQQVNPNAPVGNWAAPSGMDGPAAKSTIDNYDRSFVNPRINQTNLGSVSGQPSGTASSPASNPASSATSTTRP